MFPFTAGPPCERVLFDHSPFYGGSLLRADAGSAATATLSRFVSILSDYFDAIRAWREWHQIKELGNNVWWFDTDCMHNALCQHAPILMPFEHGGEVPRAYA